MPIFTPEMIAHYAATIEPEKAAPVEQHPSKTLFRSVGLPVLIGGQGADLVTTLDAIKSGRGTEANPVLAGSPAKIAAIKALGTGGLAWFLDHLAGSPNPTTRKAALLAALAGGGIGAGLAVHNAQAGR